jgi:hypothetical protein
VDIVSDCMIHGEVQFVPVRGFCCFGAISDQGAATAVTSCVSSVDYIVRRKLVRSDFDMVNGSSGRSSDSASWRIELLPKTIVPGA